MQASQLARAFAAAISIVLVSLALLGATWYGSGRTSPASHVVGVPTGQFVNGVEIHRLPSITVTASRSDIGGAATK